MRYILDDLGFIEAVSCNHFNCEGKSKNLLNLSSFVTQTMNGITFTNNGNGSITINGTASTGFGVNFVKLVLKKGTYHLSLNATTPTDFYVYDYDTNTNILNKETTSTLTKDYENIGFDTWINQGITFNNITIYPQIEVGDIATTFSPYGIVEKSCNEYTGAIPEGYESLDDWVLNANIRAYKIANKNLVFDATRDAELEAEWAKAGRIEDYSTEEKIIGSWIDGKSLYRKVISLGNLPNATTKEIATGLSNVIVTKITGYARTSGTNIPLPYIDTGSAANGIMFITRENGSKLIVTAGTNRSAWIGYVSLEYTKI
jgi:hypothetical protein